MALLPARNILDGTALPVTSQMKTALGSLRDYCSDLLGTDSSNKAAARTALGAAASGANADITSLTALTSVPTALTPIGNGQTWQMLTGSRALGTNYTNSTGRTIAVVVCVNSTGAGNLINSATVGGVIASFSQTPVSSVGFVVSSTFIVPAGAVYSIAASGATALYSWAELR